MNDTLYQKIGDWQMIMPPYIEFIKIRTDIFKLNSKYTPAYNDWLRAF